jgi:HSP20 family molecular chaperone IbpA
MSDDRDGRDDTGRDDADRTDGGRDDGRRDDAGREDGDNERHGGLLGGLRSLLETLADAERDGTSRVSRSRRSARGRFDTESGFSARIGRPSSRSDADSITDRSAADDRPDVDAHVDVRHDDDGRLVVVADMPDVDPEDLTVGLDEAANELVVGVDDHAVERLPLPWPVDDVEGRFNHGVLELHITATEDAT